MRIREGSRSAEPMDQTPSLNGRDGWLESRPHFRPDIEGLRAIAILLVLGFHAKVPGFSGGFIGVDVFFVLSGYLITWILVDEAARTGTVDLVRFYARRARRLLPALLFMLLVTMVATVVLLAPLEQQPIARTWVATAAYVSNLYFAASTVTYDGPRAETNPLLHTWSLSVEEQFYLVWPWLILLGLGILGWQRGRTLPSRRRLIRWLAGAVVVSFGYSLAIGANSHSWAFYLSPTRAWEFGVGALAILLPPLSSAAPRLGTAIGKRLVGVSGWLGLGGLVVATVGYDTTVEFPGTAAVLPVLATVAMLRVGASATPAMPLQRLLSAAPFQVAGRLSYSAYLWHWPALVLATTLSGPLNLGQRLLTVAASLILAGLSYRLVENPIRTNPRVMQRPRFALGAAVVGCLLCAGLAAGWGAAIPGWSASDSQAHFRSVARTLPRIYRDGCDHFGSAEVTACIYGDTMSVRTVVLIGDSHAGQFFPAVEQAAEDAGWRLIVLTLSACPVVDLPVMYNETLGRSYPECVRWRRDALETVGRIRPQLTIVASTGNYRASQDEWESGTRSALERLLGRSERVALVLDPPSAGIDIPACLARAAWRGSPLAPECAPRGIPGTDQLVEAQERAGRSIPGVEIVDVRAEVCVIGVCGPMQGPLVRYRNAGHISVEFAETFRTTFLDLLLAGPSVPDQRRVNSREPNEASPRGATLDG